MQEQVEQAAMGIVDKVGSYVDAMAEQLGVAGTFLWETLIRQMYVNGVVHLGVSLLAMGGIYLAYKNFKKGDNMPLPSSYGDDEKAARMVISFIVGLAFSIVAFVCMVWAVMYLANPEYQALMKIVEAVR
jgi:hypothetical protein